MSEAETVVLVHGLFMTGHELAMLRRRLEREHGYRTRLFAYRSVGACLDDNAERLAHYLGDVADGPVHVVGHSLGGLVMLRAAERRPDLPLGRLVALGSPVAGSRVASTVACWPFGPRILGRSIVDGAVYRTAWRWAGPQPVGVVAGTTSVGMGRFLARLELPNDGTVTVAETRLVGAADHIVLPVSHFSMLLSPLVAEQVAAFLGEGTFRHPVSGESLRQRLH